jgi:hypothetical protein
MNERTKLNGRRVVVLRGRDPTEDSNRIVDALVASEADLFDRDGILIWANEGRPVQVNKAELLELSSKYLVTKRLRTTGTGCEVEYRPLDFSTPDNRIIISMLNAITERVPKA